MEWYFLHTLVGLNLRMTELSAAIAREQLKKLDGILQTVREHAKYFPVKVRPECEHSFYRYAWMLQQPTMLPPENFNFKRHYIQPIYKMPLFKSLGYADNLCPVCEEVEENIVLSWLKGMG
jgi:dTDP-4-amino-4,6-dideoxygalactose transaminase